MSEQMNKLLLSLMDEPLSTPNIKFCDSFDMSKGNTFKFDEKSKFFNQVVEQAHYLPENELKNDEIGAVIAGWLKKKKRLNVVRWEPNNLRYPKYMLLGTDKGILAYIEFFYHRSEEDISDDIVGRTGICHIMKDLRSRISLVDSDLDRPVFYVHVVDYKNQKGIFFETTEMIKNNIFERSESIYEDAPLDLYFSNISEMGDLDELVCIFEDLKKNNVRFY